MMMPSVNVSSRFLFDLVAYNTNPSARTVREWVQKISEVLKVGIRYTERLGDVLVNRSRYLIRRMRDLKGGGRDSSPRLGRYNCNIRN